MAQTDYAGATWEPSPNFGWQTTGQHGRPAAIQGIVVHGTAGPGAVSWFQTPNSAVSAHYVVLETGQVVQCVREDDVAWHAGEVTPNSSFAGTNPNLTYIGVEHERNTANDGPLTPAQQASSIALITDIRRRRGALPLVPHDAIDVGRVCPGPGFPLATIDAAAQIVKSVVVPASLTPGPGIMASSDWGKHDHSRNAPGIIHLLKGDAVTILNWYAVAEGLTWQRIRVARNGQAYELWVVQSNVQANPTPSASTSLPAG